MKRKHYLPLLGVLLLALFAGEGHAGIFFNRHKNDGPAPESQFFEVNGVKIHYVMQGSGTPVMLIHAWLSSADGNWVKPGTMAQLAKNHRVIALDLAGYGDSASPDNPAAYGDGWVEQVYQLMNHLNIPKAHIAGYSMGGMITLKFLAVHPDRTLSGFLGGMGYMPQGGKYQQKWAGMSALRSKSASQLALTPDQVRSIRVPVEMVVGSRDPVKESYIAPMLQVRSDWPVVEVPGKGHITAMMSQEFKDDLANWVDRQSASGQ